MADAGAQTEGRKSAQPGGDRCHSITISQNRPQSEAILALSSSQAGTQSFDLVDHIGLAGRRREKCRSTAYPPGTSPRYWRVYLSLSRPRLRCPDYPSRSSSFRSRDWMGFGFIACCRVRGLESQCRRCGLNCDLTTPAAGQDRQSRRRSPSARSAGIQTRRTACLRHGQDADARGRRPPPTLP